MLRFPPKERMKTRMTSNGLAEDPTSRESARSTTGAGNQATLEKLGLHRDAEVDAEADADLVLDLVAGSGTRYGFAKAVLVRAGMCEAEATPREVRELAHQEQLVKEGQDARWSAPATRAEAVKMAMVGFGLPVVEGAAVKQVFRDLPPMHWSAPYAYGALAARLLSGYDDRSFAPNDAASEALRTNLLEWGPSGEGEAPYTFDPRKPGGVEAIKGLTGDTTSTSRNLNIDRSATGTRQEGASEKENAGKAIDIISALDPVGNPRYQSGASSYCNVFAVDFAYAMGAFLPRVWWNDPEGALAASQRGEPLDGFSTFEVRANGLHKWLNEWGRRFGWALLGDAHDEAALREGQSFANKGHVSVITGSTDPPEALQWSTGGGHVTVIRPETEAAGKGTEDEQCAAATTSGAYIPLQAEAGLDSEDGRGNTSGSTYFYFLRQMSQYKGGISVWVHL